jgi:hypothetical protein
MQNFNSTLLFRIAAVWGVIFTPAVLQGEIIDGWNWADDAFDYSDNIQNFAGTRVDDSTEWWLTGPADTREAGWRSMGLEEYIVMFWQTGIPDLPGNDLVIHLFSGPGASASVLASPDAGSFTPIGTLGGGAPQQFRTESFDFNNLFHGDIHYLKVQRETEGSGTGMFFDAFAGNVPVPETGIMIRVAAAAMVILFSCRIPCLSSRWRIKE